MFDSGHSVQGTGDCPPVGGYSSVTHVHDHTYWARFCVSGAMTLTITDAGNAAVSRSYAFTVSAAEAHVESVTVSAITQTGATVTATVTNPVGATGIIHFRHRETGGAWSALTTAFTATTSASNTLTGLSSNTDYEAEASTSRMFAAAHTESATFTTAKVAATVDAMAVSAITQTGATVTATVTNPDGATGIIHFRHRETGGAWSALTTAFTATTSASNTLTGLSSNTDYEAEASTSRMFAAAHTESATFTTAKVAATVDAMAVSAITQTGATVTATVTNPDGASTTVYTRYRTPQAGTGTYTDGPTSAATVGTVATVTLTGLSRDTEYRLQVAVDSAFTTTAEADFLTVGSSVFRGNGVGDHPHGRHGNARHRPQRRS